MTETAASDLPADAAGDAGTRPRLLVVEITTERVDQWYNDELEKLTVHTVAVAEQEGWEARRLPVAEVDEAEIERAEAWADAIVVMGGEDVAPQYYDGEPHYEGQGPHHELADGRMIDMIRRSVGHRTPVLGICRGHQLVNVAFGGTLIQHLDNAGDHEPARDAGTFIRHAVDLEPDSVLGRRFGDEAIGVDSAHHQAIGVLGTNLRVTATAPDGTIEAIEHRTAPIIAIQWHPEYPGADPRQLVALFAELRANVRV